MRQGFSGNLALPDVAQQLEEVDVVEAGAEEEVVDAGHPDGVAARVGSLTCCTTTTRCRSSR